jgi:4-alpha-glucanotransferase
MDDLAATAQIWGVELRYHDIFGATHSASAQTLARLIDAMSAVDLRPQQADIAPPNVLRAFQGDGRKHWALAVQLYAVRSRRNWGHGDFSDLARLVTLAAAHGASAIGLNPLHALFADRAEQASPYSPSSRHYLNALYIDVEAVPEFPGLDEAGLAAEVNALRAMDAIAYGRVARAKYAGLRAAYARFRSAATPQRRADFEAYRCEQGDALLSFGCFETLHRRFSLAPWRDWPQPWRSPSPADLRRLRAESGEECEFHEFVQWTADRQLRACRDHGRACGMPIGLYIDLAVGVDPHGADAWNGQGVLLATVSIGAPPDDFNPAGQNWGLAPFNPHALPANDFEPLRHLLRASMAYAGAIRLDHVLGLKRIFMIPHGGSAADGAYVRFPFEQQLRVIAEESHRHRCIVIGEDLGTVPEDFRATLSRWGVWTYRVMQFERFDDARFRPPNTYPAEALATFNTHDMPTLQGWLQRRDFRLRQDIGLEPGEPDAAREQSVQALRAAIAEWTSGYREVDIAAVAAFLAATPSRLVSVSLEDVLDVVDPINIPGTVEQYRNWRHRLPLTLDEIESQESLRRVAQVFADSGRANSP